MSATISLMYKKSGGCFRKHKCAECRYIHALSNRAFKTWRCAEHERLTGSDDGIWNPNWMACRSYAPKKKSQKEELKQDETGQLYFITA